MHPMTSRTFLISGASGWLGQALAAHLTSEGNAVRRLVRRAPTEPGEYRWDPATGAFDRAALTGTDVIVHLAGEGIADARWTAARKQLILRSRVDGTELIAREAAASGNPNLHLISASAVGFYGNAGSQPCDESTPSGSGFLAEVCRAWEGATAAAAALPLTHIRIGVVVGPGGGFLARMLPIFRAGLGGRLGTGEAWTSWISRHDLCRAIGWTAAHRLTGTVNLTGPAPCTNADLTAELGTLLHRPTRLPAPSFALRLAMGEMADELLLAGQRALPARLQASGFSYDHPTFRDAARWALEEK